MTKIETIREDLRASDPAINFSVLSRINVNGWNPQELEDLEKVAQSETDQGTRFHLELLLRQIKEKKGDKKSSEEFRQGVDEVLRSPRPDFFTLIVNITNVPAPDGPAILKSLRTFGFRNFPDEVLPFILRFLAKHGTPDDLPALEESCRHPNPQILAAAIEAVEKIHPESLKPLLVSLLVHPVPGIRSKAVRLLYEWDPGEAVAHLEEMLFSEDPQERLGAIFHSFLFPFPAIEDLLLKFLSLEEDLTLLKRAGKLFIINPSLSGALRLMELWETSREARKQAVQEILRGVIDFLCKAKISSKTPQETLEDLKVAYRNQKVRRVCERCELLLASESVQEKTAAVSRLLELAAGGFSQAGDLLSAHEARETNADVKNKIRNGLNGLEGKGPHAETGEQVQTDADRWVACLQESDSELVVKALEALLATCPERLSPYLENLLLSPSLEVQVAAMHGLTVLDRKKALGVFEQFLFSVQPERRKAGIFCSEAFDFPSVRVLLLKALGRENHPENFRHFTGLLLPHLDELLLFQIFSLSRSSEPGTPSKSVPSMEICGHCPSLAGTFLELAKAWMKDPKATFSSVESLSESFTSRLNETLRAEAEASKLYSVANIQKLRAASNLPDHKGQESAPVSSQPEEPADLKTRDSLLRFHFIEKISSQPLTKARISQISWCEKSEKDNCTKFHLGVLLAKSRQTQGPSGTEENPVLAIERILGPLERHHAGAGGPPGHPSRAAPQDLRHPWLLGGIHPLMGLGSTPTDFTGLVLALEKLNRRTAGPVLSLLREKSWTLFPVEVLPFVLQAFRRFGAPEDGAVISGFCRHPDPRVTAMAVEALERLNLEDLKPLLVRLLISENPSLRALSVRLLSKWDPPEAVRHFEANLFSEDPEERHASLYQAFFLSFTQIEPYLLKYVSLENDLALLKKAGNIFKINPGPDVPLRMIGVIENTSGEKRRLLGEVLQTIVEALSKAGLVQKAPEQILEDLKQEYRRKKAFDSMQNCKMLLSSSEIESRMVAIFQLKKFAAAGFAHALELLKRHYANEKEVELKLLIQPLVEMRKAVVTKDVAAPEKLAPEELVQWLQEIDQETFSRLRTGLLNLLGKTSAAGKVAILAGFRKFGLKPDAEALKKLLKDPEWTVVVAGIETLEVLIPDTLQSMLPRFLEHPSQEVKATAVRAFIRLDQKQALNLVEQMLGAKKPSQRSAAIFSLQSFDFAVVQDLLLTTLQQEENPENLNQIGLVFRNHLSSEVFLRVLGAVRGVPEKRQECLATYLSGLAEELAKKDPKQFATGDAAKIWANEQLQILEKKKKQPPPVYDLQRIQQLREEQKARREAERPILEKISDALSQAGIPETALPLVFIGIVGVIVCLGWVMLPLNSQVPSKSATEMVQAPAAPSLKKDEGFSAGKIVGVQGVIAQITSEGVHVALDGKGKRLFVRFPGSVPRYRVGAPFRARIKMEKQEGDLIKSELVATY